MHDWILDSFTRSQFMIVKENQISLHFFNHLEQTEEIVGIPFKLEDAEKLEWSIQGGYLVSYHPKV